MNEIDCAKVITLVLTSFLKANSSIGETFSHGSVE